MAEAVRTKRSGGAKKATHAEPREEPSRATCPVTFCPICIAVTGTQPVRAEVMGHLLAAGRELLQAVQAAASPGPSSRDEDRPARLEKIDLG